MGRSSSNKAEWLGVLETAAKVSVEQSSAVWVWIMQELRLGPQYFLAVREAVQQGRWRTAKNPKAYLKTVVKREARKMGLVDETSNDLVTIGGSEGEETTSEEALEHLEHRHSSRGAAKEADGVWRAGGGGGGDPLGRGKSYRGRLMAGVPDELRVVEQPSDEYRAVLDQVNENNDEVHFHAQPQAKPDWRSWAEAAGLDHWEKRVLEYRLSGAGWRVAVASQPDEESRKALQAAWKRFERTGMERLRATAKIKLAENVPEDDFEDTSY
ncbi:MAG TPA: hypothetical protein VGH51_02880 [Candidatus Angelobacter sp.]|jgi:hypothetical protein